MNAAMMPLQAMAEEKVRERLREMQEGKRSESRDLLTLMRALLSNRAEGMIDGGSSAG